MEPIIERKTLASQVADRIEESIRKGIWTDRLPGLRTLAEHFRVNRKTCIAAVILLENRGLLIPAEVGKRRTILADASLEKAAGLSGRRLLIIQSPLSVLNFDDQSLLHSYQEVWERAEGTASWARVDYSRYQNPKRLLRTLIERHGAEALLLHMPEENWSREANAILPTYQLGGLYESEEGVSMNAYRLSVEIQRVAAHLHSLGHERIMVPIGNFAEGMRESTIKALAAGVGKKPAKGTWADHCPRFAESLPEAWERYWKSAFAKLNPTTVILIEDVHLLSLYGYCAANRIAIPDALSVVLMAWNPQFEWCVPMPCMHRFPLAKSTYLFKRWIANGMKVTGAKYLPLDPLDGKSVAAPRKR